MAPQNPFYFVTTGSTLTINRKICCCLPLTQMYPPQNPGNLYLNTQFLLIDQSVVHAVQEHDTGAGELTAGINFNPKRFSAFNSVCVSSCLCSENSVGHLSTQHSLLAKLNFTLKPTAYESFWIIN